MAELEEPQIHDEPISTTMMNNDNPAISNENESKQEPEQQQQEQSEELLQQPDQQQSSSSLLDSFRGGRMPAPSIAKPVVSESKLVELIKKRKWSKLEFDITNMNYDQYCDRHYANEIEGSGVLPMGDVRGRGFGGRGRGFVGRGGRGFVGRGGRG